MNDVERDQPRPAEVVGVRGPLVPPPFTAKAPLPPPRRSRWRPRLLLTGVAVAEVVAVLFLAGGPRARPTRSAANGPSVPPAATSSAAQTAAASVDRELAAQTRALLAGDLNGYLAPVDASLRDEFTLRFGSLRALGVAAWDARVSGPLAPLDGHRWQLIVHIGYCLGAADCAQVNLRLPSTWTVSDGHAVATAFQRTVLPWDLTPLRAVAGPRVIVAAPEADADRLAGAVVAAENAAAVADRFARWDPPPKRYVVYLAGPDEWHTWWNGKGEDGDGYAEGPYGVEIRTSLDEDHGRTALLTHELTHVVTISDQYGDDGDWWLYEGLAEYAADHNGAWTRDRLPYVRQYIKAGRWDGSITLGATPSDATPEDSTARYGLALLAVSCLAKRFGEDHMLDFFAAVVRGYRTLEVASTTAFGTPWPPVAADCAAEIRARTT